MIGRWDKWYKDVNKMGSFRYGNTASYQLAEDFLQGLDVEDWGCGAGGFRRLHKGGYVGIDGTKNPFVDKVVDLRHYRSRVDGINMRHVIEHNYDWRMVLENALASFNKRFCLTLFTPFQDETKEIVHNAKDGVDVPDMGFKQSDIEDYLKPFKWRMETIKSHVHYRREHIYYIEK